MVLESEVIDSIPACCKCMHVLKGWKIIGLNGPASSCPVTRGWCETDVPNHVRSSARLIGKSHNGDPWTLYLNALSEFVAFF